MKNRTVIMAALLVGLFTAPAFAVEDIKAYSLFVRGTDAWSENKGADIRTAKINKEDNAWALFHTSTKLWRKSKAVIPKQDMGDRYVNLFGTTPVIRTTN